MASCKKCHVILSEKCRENVKIENKLSLAELHKRHVVLLCNICKKIEKPARSGRE